MVRGFIVAWLCASCVQFPDSGLVRVAQQRGFRLGGAGRRSARAERSVRERAALCKRIFLRVRPGKLLVCALADVRGIQDGRGRR